MNHARHLLLKCVYNTRDLGGYASAFGGTTRFGVFLRSDAPCDLPESDIRSLLDYGLTASMDLRSDGERLARPSSLRNAAAYYEEPLFAQAAIYGEKPPVSPGASWTERYIDMAEISKDWAVRALTIAANEKGCLLYHCTTGKDRTGLMTCYLLSLAGVPKEDIAADYCVSELFLTPVYDRMRAGKVPISASTEGTAAPPPPSGEDFFRTPASAMLGLIDYFDAQYGGVTAYLRAAGLSADIIGTIRNKLIEPA